MVPLNLKNFEKGSPLVLQCVVGAAKRCFCLFSGVPKVTICGWVGGGRAEGCFCKGNVKTKILRWRAPYFVRIRNRTDSNARCCCCCARFIGQAPNSGKAVPSIGKTNDHKNTHCVLPKNGARKTASLNPSENCTNGLLCFLGWFC